MTTLQLTFTKGAGKFDVLDLLRADGSRHRIDCPKQGIIPHDMVHYAVEHTLEARGFLHRVKAGESADFRMEAQDLSDGVERFVEVLQGDAWSGGGTPAGEVLDLYRVTCAARSCPVLPLGTAEVDAARAAMADLTARWQALPVGGVLVLDL